MEQQNEDKGKIAKKFIESMSKLTAILNGETLYKPLKASTDDVKHAIEELAKEEKEALIVKLKAEAKALIQEKRSFDASVAAKKKEIEKLIEAEQKKFTERAQEVFKLVENVGAIEKAYLATLGEAVTGIPQEPEEPEEMDPSIS